jgi:hypothetical protein
LALGQLLVASFWLAILMGEQRSFLRSRELYADNVAALAFGGGPIKDALGTSDAPEEGQLAWRGLDKIFPARFGWLGYVIGLMHVVAWTIRDLPDVTQGSMESSLRLLLTTESGLGLFLFLILLLSSAVTAVGSLIFRTSCWIRLVDLPVREKIRRLTQSAFALGIGLFLGLYLNPFSILLIVNGANVSVIISDIGRLQAGLFVFAQILAAIIISMPLVGRLLTSPRNAAPGLITWIAIAFGLYFTVSYGSSAFFALFDPDVARRGDSVRTPLLMLGLGFAFWSLGYLFARGTLTFGKVPATSIAPWVVRLQSHEKASTQDQVGASFSSGVRT